MSTARDQFPDAAERVSSDAASRMEIWRDQALPSGRSDEGRTRRGFDLALVLILICLSMMPPLVPAEATLPAIPGSASDTPGDEHWAVGFNTPDMDSSVYALAFGPDGSLYAGGDFTWAGGVAANRVARWNGSQWHPLGSGMDSTVRALTFGPDGSLYAGGEFTTAGGVAASRIARWDGLEWHPLGSGMGPADYYPYVYALAVALDSSLYAGGAFTTAGGKPSS